MSFLEEKKPDVLQDKEGRTDGTTARRKAGRQKERGKDKQRHRNRGNRRVICKEKLMGFFKWINDISS